MVHGGVLMESVYWSACLGQFLWYLLTYRDLLPWVAA